MAIAPCWCSFPWNNSTKCNDHGRTPQGANSRTERVIFVDYDTFDTVVQQADDAIDDIEQTGDDDPLERMFCEFDADDDATEFLNSLEGRLAAERDRLRAEGRGDDAIADIISELDDEAASLSFTVNSSASGKVSGQALKLTATIVTGGGEQILEVETFNPAERSERLKFAQRLADLHPAIDPVDAEQKLICLAAELNKSELPPEKDAKPGEETSATRLQQMPEKVRKEAREMLEDPQLLDRIVADIQALGVAGERQLILTLYLAGVSRLLVRPLAVIIQSLSSSGKSFVAETVARTFPPETVLVATTITSQALYYLSPGALQHRFVIAGERSRRQDDDIADATKALREMIASGRLSKLLPIKDKKSGYTTVRIEQAGPIAFCESTTASDIFEEDKNRCLIVSTDERPQQTQLVLDRIAEMHSGTQTTKHDEIIQRHWALQRMLVPRPVVIPFAKALARKFSNARVEARRAFNHLLSMIGASALLHQYQRQLDDEQQIIAEFSDYEIAVKLCRKPLARLLGGRMSDAAIEFHGRLLEWVGETFTTTEAVKTDNKSRQAVSGWLSELAALGAVRQVAEGKGPKPAVWELTGTPQEEVARGGFELPTASELTDAETPETETGFETPAVPEEEVPAETDDVASRLLEEIYPDEIPF